MVQISTLKSGSSILPSSNTQCYQYAFFFLFTGFQYESSPFFRESVRDGRLLLEEQGVEAMSKRMAATKLISVDAAFVVFLNLNWHFIRVGCIVNT